MVRCTSTRLRSWKNDKLSRLFIRRKMRGITPYLFGADTFTRVLMYVAIGVGIGAGIMQHAWWLMGTSIALWLIYFGCRMLILHKTSQDLDERKYNASLLLFDIIQPCWELFFRLYLLLMPKRMHLRKYSK